MTARAAAGAAVGCGFVAAVALAASARGGVHVLGLHAAGATALWLCLAASAPFELLVSAAAGVLQGNGRVGAAAVLRVAKAAGGIASAAGALYVTRQGLLGVGIGTLATAAAAAALGWALVAALPPDGCPRRNVLAVRRDDDGDECAAESAEGGGDGQGDFPAPPAPFGAFLRKFAADGADMLVRSAMLKLSFVAAMCVARSLGEAAFDAHAVVTQLWMMTSYLADGFATAGTVLCPRIAAARDRALVDGDGDTARSLSAALRRACNRLLLAGVAVGVLAGVLFWCLEEELQTLFLGSDEEAKDTLRTWLWPYLAAVQVLNSVVFVQDGLLAAGQWWKFIRNFFLVGTIALFAPALAAGRALAPAHSALGAVWVAKGVLNIWRALCAGWRIETWLRDGERACGAGDPESRPLLGGAGRGRSRAST